MSDTSIGKTLWPVLLYTGLTQLCYPLHLGEIVKRILLAVLVASGLGLGQVDHGNMSMAAMAELGKLSGKDFDIAYMSMMIEHHRGAVQMAQQALRVSRDARIRGAAQDVINVQNKEITQLTDWLRRWYGVAPSQRYMNMMRADMKGMMDKAMSGMQAHEGMVMPVDRAFLEGMIPHHQDAVDMSELALKKASKPELRKFAQEVIRVQKAEIARYQAWLKTL